MNFGKSFLFILKISIIILDDPVIILSKISIKDDFRNIFHQFLVSNNVLPLYRDTKRDRRLDRWTRAIADENILNEIE